MATPLYAPLPVYATLYPCRCSTEAASGAMVEAFVSWRQITFGRARSRKRSIDAERARSELIFHVASRNRSCAGAFGDIPSRAARAAIRRLRRAAFATALFDAIKRAPVTANQSIR